MVSSETIRQIIRCIEKDGLVDVDMKKIFDFTPNANWLIHTQTKMLKYFW